MLFEGHLTLSAPLIQIWSTLIHGLLLRKLSEVAKLCLLLLMRIVEVYHSFIQKQLEFCCFEAEFYKFLFPEKQLRFKRRFVSVVVQKLLSVFSPKCTLQPLI